MVLALLYKRTSKERRTGNPPTLNNLSLYTLHLPPSNHSLCLDIPSEYSTMILHTTNMSLINTTTPHLLTSQHLRPFPYHNILHCHHLTIFPHHLPIYSHLHLSETLSPSIHPMLFLNTFRYTTHSSSRDSIPLLGSTSSEKMSTQPWLRWITLMELPYWLQPIDTLCRFPCHRIIPSPPYKVL